MPASSSVFQLLHKARMNSASRSPGERKVAKEKKRKNFIFHHGLIYHQLLGTDRKIKLLFLIG